MGLGIAAVANFGRRAAARGHETDGQHPTVTAAMRMPATEPAGGTMCCRAKAVTSRRCAWADEAGGEIRKRFEIFRRSM